MTETRDEPRASSLPATYWILWGGNVLNRAGGFVNFVLAYFVSTDLGYDEAATGLVLGILAGGAAAGALAGGQLADFWGRKPTLFVSQVAAAVCMVLLGFAGSWWMLTGAAALLGVFQGMSRPAFGALMIDVIPHDLRMRAFSLTYWGNNIAAAVAATLGGLVAGYDYRVAFWVDGATTLVAAFVILYAAREPLRAARPEPVDGRRVSDSPWHDSVFLVWCGLTFLSTLVFAQHLSTLPLTMSDAGLGPQVFGVLITINTVMIVVGQPLIPKLVKGRSPSKVLALGSVIVGCGFGLTALVGQAWGFALAIVVWTLGEMLQNPAGGTLTAGLAPVSARGRYQALGSMTISVSMMVAPIVGGWTMQAAGSDVVWIACFVIGLIGAAVHLSQAKARDARLAKVADA